MKSGKIIIITLLYCYVFWDIFVFMILFMDLSYKNLSIFSLNGKSQLYYFIALITLIVAYISLNFSNKDKWPLVQGKIVNSIVVRDILRSKQTYTLKHYYSFYFNGEKYTKSVNQNNLLFRSYQEGNNYLREFVNSNKKLINVYVFKPYPQYFSSHTKKINALYIFFIYIVILSTSLLILFGFVLSLASIGQATIGPISGGSYQFGTSQDLQNLLKNIYSKNIILSLVTPVSLIIILLIYLFKSVKLLLKNKIFFIISKVDEIYPDQSDNQVGINKIVCLKCNSKNDETSLFCTNCGASLKY